MCTISTIVAYYNSVFESQNFCYSIICEAYIFFTLFNKLMSSILMQHAMQPFKIEINQVHYVYEQIEMAQLHFINFQHLWIIYITLPI